MTEDYSDEENPISKKNKRKPKGSKIRTTEASDSVKKKYVIQTKNLLSCHICDQKFKFQCRLLRHVNSHTNNRPYNCSVCSSNFFDSTLLKRHMLTHTKEFPFHCNICSKQFYTKSDHDKHLKIHNGEKPFKCKDCNESFLHSKTLSRHRKVVHSGLTPYPCEICDKTFPTFTTMIEHRKIHGEYKPYMCEICDKAFSKSVNLREHYGLHTGLKLYNCRVCGKGFGYPASLRKHMLTTDACTNRLRRESTKKPDTLESSDSNNVVSVVVVESVNIKPTNERASFDKNFIDVNVPSNMDVENMYFEPPTAHIIPKH
ncbi:uncharacterized protein LOC143909439 [Arctopsyche grandis]|uniref:uncharacterized protein LOC143909439 n=1 Tax=Arctopsyche grandis TaxID=121162 RepID=UPI00406D6827